MSDLETYLDRIIDEVPVTEAPVTKEEVPVVDRAGHIEILPHSQLEEAESEESVNILGILLRRWYIVLTTFVVFTAIGVPAVWYLVEPGYIVAGLIHVAPAQEDLLSGDTEQGFEGDYELFKTTQAMRMTSTVVLENVASELASRSLTMLNEKSDTSIAKITRLIGIETHGGDPLDYLKSLVRFGVVKADSIPHSQFVKVSMKSMKADEAQIIVDSIMQNYQSTFTSQVKAGKLDSLQALEDERNALLAKMKSTNGEIRGLADKYGTSSLDVTQELMLQRATTLLTQLADLEATRIDLESSMDFIEEDEAQGQAMLPNSTLADRNEYVGADPLVQELTSTIVELDRELVIAEQTLAFGNPALKERKELLSTFNERLETARTEVGAEFDSLVVQRTVEMRDEKIAATQRAIDRIKAHEEKLRGVLSQQEIRTRDIGRTHMDISDLEFQQSLNRELHENVSRRMRDKEMEKKRDPVIQVDTWAEIEEYEDNRVKFSMGFAFGALGFGALLSLLRDKMDKRLKQPEDVTKCIHVPLLGTVLSSSTVKPSLFAEQIAGDYQAIRTNLELYGNGIPRELAVTSACMQEAKTVFSTNLATSLAKSGRRVLLVDGDLRKPEVLAVLDASNLSQCRTDAVAEGRFAYTLWTVTSSGLDVLVPDFSRPGDAYELLASPVVAQRIELLGQRYDHIIIDTPPVLAFPDAIIWAKIAGRVVLSCFAGRTTSHELNEAKLRITQTNAVILGAVMSNVGGGHGYQRYGQNYYGKSQCATRITKRHKKKALLSTES